LGVLWAFYFPLGAVQSRGYTEIHLFLMASMSWKEINLNDANFRESST
jgi:hypothetical protein